MKELVRAAGGLVWRHGRGGEVQVALIHRPAYDDWSLPKGKLRDGEGEEEAALREVEEETGLRCRLGRPLGVNRYLDRRGRPKEVRYWLMRPLDGTFRPNKEVDELRWLPAEEAERLLTYQHDRDLVRGLEGAA
jgi:8-oxo-dGTP pyrophosphatase MutT (NUDIX family)